jgi:hypothetical protein
MEIWSLLLIAPLFPAVTVSRLKQT